MRRGNTRIWFLIALIAALACILGLVGCGGDDEGVTDPPSPTGEEIGPQGGTASFDGGAVSVNVPAGALAQATALTATAMVSPAAGVLAGTAYDLGPEGTTFALPVTLTFAYDPAELPAGQWHIDLRLCRYVASAWIPLVDSAVDSVAHTLSATTTHFSSFGIGGEAAGEVVTQTAYLLDNPAEEADNEFSSLVAALAWLDDELGYEDLGILVWQTSTHQSVESLAFAYDLMVDLESGYTAVIEGPVSGPLVIDAAGAIDLSDFSINASGGLVLNANRNVAVAGCTLPDVTTINIGGVLKARFPAAEPGYKARSAAAQKRAKGSIILSNKAQILNVNFAGGGTIEGDHTIDGNEAQNLNVGGPAALGGISELVCRTPGPPAPFVPVPYPNIGPRLTGNAKLKVKGFKGIQLLRSTVNADGNNRVEYEDLEGEEATIRLEGGGHAEVVVSHGDIAATTGMFTVWSMDVRIEGQNVARTMDLTFGGNSAEMTMTGGRVEEKLDIRAEEVTEQITVTSTDDTFTGDADLTLPTAAAATVTLTGTEFQGARVSIGPPTLKGDSKGPAGLKTSGSVTLTDLSWTGEEGSDHIDINGIEGPVTISGGTISNTGSLGVNLGLTEIGGSINVDGVSFTGGGIGLVDCTGAATITDCNLTITAGYGVSAGGSAGVTLSGTTMVCSGNSNAVQTFEMNGSLSISGCNLDASAGLTVFSFHDVTVNANSNSLIAGMVVISSSSVTLTGNTFSGALIMDDLSGNPGLVNDPVADNDGLLPGMVYTHMDWDGNGCCDYPPEWNQQDDNGNCAVCTAQGK